MHINMINYGNKLKAAQQTAILLGLVLLVCIIYSDTLLSLWDLWCGQGNRRYTHGPLVVVFSVALCVWRYRTHQNAIQLSFYPGVLLPLFLSSVLFALASSVHVLIIQQLLFPISIVLILASILGKNVLRLFAVQVGLLFFTIPVWEYLNTPLRVITTPIVTMLLQLSQIPATADGFYIAIPAGLFFVDVACSGLSSMIVILTATALYTQLLKCSLKHSVGVVAFAAALAFVTNIIRIYIIIVAGQLSDMQHYWVVQEHDSLGAVLFMIVFVVYLYVLSFYFPFKRPLFNTHDIVVERGRQQHASLMPLNFVLLVIVFCSGPLLMKLLQSQQMQAQLNNFAMPTQFGQWEIKENPEIISFGNNFTTSAIYQHSTASKVEVRVQYYRDQQQGNEAVNENNLLYDNTQWRLQSKRIVDFDYRENIASVEWVVVNTAYGKQRVIARCYYVNDKVTAYPVAAKWYNLLGILQGEPHISVLTISTLVDQGLPDTEFLLKTTVVAALSATIESFELSALGDH